MLLMAYLSCKVSYMFYYSQQQLLVCVMCAIVARQREKIGMLAFTCQHKQHNILFEDSGVEALLGFSDDHIQVLFGNFWCLLLI